MKVLVCSDSFKDTFSSRDINQLICHQVKDIHPEWNVQQQEISDGGEGWLSIIKQYVPGTSISIPTLDALFRPLITNVWKDNENRFWFDTAGICGLSALSLSERNPWKTSSIGIGLVLRSIDTMNPKEIILGLGGSAMNDGGAGLLEGLGAHWVDQNGNLLHYITPATIPLVDQFFISFQSSTPIRIATDVRNPLVGPTGATFTFARQKGAKEEDIPELENRMHTWITLLNTYAPRKINCSAEGMGAAGGIPAVLSAYYPATLVSGFDVLSTKIGLEQLIQDSDWIITGEGKSDWTTLSGKAPYRVAQLAKKYNKKVMLISGAVDTKITPMLHPYFDIIFSIQKPGESVQDSIAQTVDRISYAVAQLNNLV
ncbi:MAG: glycerate kinase [Cytophagaceae bacterium]|nr:glycerate kinase [Cytophagaceae bacterium]